MSEVDLRGRMAFMSFDAAQVAALETLRPIIDKGLDGALEAFYAKIRATPEVRTFFRDDRQIETARMRQGEHWQRLFSGQFDDAYAQAVRTIGQTHARIGLGPRWYVGGYALIAEQLVHLVVEDRQGSLLGRLQSKPKDLATALGAMVKAIMLDMELAISIYIEALDDGRRKAEAQRAAEAEAQTQALDVLAANLKEIAGGHLATRLEAAIAPQFEGMKQNFNTAVQTLESAMQAISRTVERIDIGNAEIAHAADELSSRTERQAAGLEQTTAAISHLTGRVKQTSESVDHMRKILIKSTGDAQAAAAVLDGMMVAMKEIETSTLQIGTITDAMDEIAFQTSLLALNAGVEAARAGEAGRGFAVVAQEVRQLAQRAAESAKSIKGLINTATGKVGEGVGYATRTDKTVRGFIGQFQEINTVIGEIAESAREQAQGLSEVNVAIADMDLATQQNAAMVEETTAATHSLAQDARALADSVSFFRVVRDEAAEAHPPRPFGPGPRAAASPVKGEARASRVAVRRKTAAAAEAQAWSEF